MNITEMTKEEREVMRLESKKAVEEKIKSFCEDNPRFAGYVKTCPASLRKQYVESLNGESGKARALKVKCLECSGWDREEVKKCTVKSCPLWQVRPYK